MKTAVSDKSKSGDPISYEESRELARDDDPGIRIDLAERADLRPEVLYFLAEDPVPEVRRLLARNESAPAQAGLLLARYDDEDVRHDLAAQARATIGNRRTDGQSE